MSSPSGTGRGNRGHPIVPKYNLRPGPNSWDRLCFGAVVVLGHPEYYPRFGFKPAVGFGIRCEYEVPEEAFMVVELEPDYLRGMSGVAKYHEAFRDVQQALARRQSRLLRLVLMYKPRRIPPPTWRECIKKVWEVDPLKCSPCQGEMKIISFINEPKIIRKILEHLDQWRIQEQPRPPPENRFTPSQHKPCDYGTGQFF